VTESEPETPSETTGSSETPEEKRVRIMARLAEMIRSDPPDLSGSGGPVTSGGLPMLPTGEDDFDQESAAALFAALGDFFKQHKDEGAEAGAEEPERE
jgi:hypothetical protein